MHQSIIDQNLSSHFIIHKIKRTIRERRATWVVLISKIIHHTTTTITVTTILISTEYDSKPKRNSTFPLLLRTDDMKTKL